MSDKLKNHTAPDGGWCDRNYWKERADERARRIVELEALQGQDPARVKAILEIFPRLVEFVSQAMITHVEDGYYACGCFDGKHDKDCRASALLSEALALEGK